MARIHDPSEPFIIAMHGEPGSGKDTVADYLVQQHGFSRIGFADRLKEACEALNPIVSYRVDQQLLTQISEGDDPTLQPVRLVEVVTELGWEKAKRKYPEIGNTQQRLATEVVRDMIQGDYWVEYVRDQMAAGVLGHRVVITDMRFPNEHAMVEAACGETWWVTRKDNPSRGGRNMGHVSERWHPDKYIRIANDGTLEDLVGVIELALASG